MRHKKKSRRLSRPLGHRKATINNLVRNLFIYQRIETTLAKAKEAKRTADTLIALGKEGSLYSKRQAYRVLGDRALTAGLFKDLAPLFKARAGGYTRIMRTRQRTGDNASLAILELVEKKAEEAPKPSTKKMPAKAKVVPSEQMPEEKKAKPAKAKPAEEKPEKLKLPKTKPAREEKKPRKFFKDLRGFFRKERDAL